VLQRCVNLSVNSDVSEEHIIICRDELMLLEIRSLINLGGGLTQWDLLISHSSPEDGGSIVLRNVATHLEVHITSQTRPSWITGIWV
jgi:hypothetical protein